MFKIVDKQTGAQVGQARTLAGARKARDRRDNAYGAVRYGIQDEFGRSRL